MPAPYRLAGRYHEPWTDTLGNRQPDASVAVYVAGTATLATLYTSTTKTTTAANPVTSAGIGSDLDSLGNLTIYADPGVYDTVTTAGGVTGPVVSIVVPINPEEVAQLGVDGQVLATQGGGGGLTEGSVTTNKLADGAVTDAKVAAGIAQSKIVNLTADLAAKIPLSQKNVANGVAGLGADAKIPGSQLPSIALSDTFVRDSQAAMLALAADVGDVCVRTDVSKSFILTASPASTLANWQELLSPSSPVQSVNGRTGVVTGLAEATDARFTDQRVPTDGSVTNAKVASGAAIAESKLDLASDAAAGVASRRTLGTGALQAAPGTLGATGTPDATTFLRGDRTWAIPVGGGGTTEAQVRRFTGDATGASDVTAAIISFLATGLPGETLQFAHRGKYLVNTNTSLSPPSGVIVDGNDAMFFSTASMDGVTSPRSQAFWEPAGCHNTTLRRINTFGFRRNLSYGTVGDVQTISIPTATTGGTFTLTFSNQTTAAIAYNATATAVADALNSLSNITAAGGVTGSGGPLPGTPVIISFNLAGDRETITGSGTSLTPSAPNGVTVASDTVALFSVANNMLSKTQSDAESSTNLGSAWANVNCTDTTTSSNPIVGGFSWQMTANAGTATPLGQSQYTMAVLTGATGDGGGPTGDESYRPFNVTTGVQYKASCLAQPQTTSTPARDYSLQINWYSTLAAVDGNFLSATESPVVTGNPEDPVELVIAPIAAPANAVAARLQFNVKAAGAALPNNEKHKFDRVSFSRNVTRALPLSGTATQLIESGDEVRVTKPDTAVNLSGMWSRVAYGQPGVEVSRIEAGAVVATADVAHPPDGNYAWDFELAASAAISNDVEIRVLSADGRSTLERRIVSPTTAAGWYRLTYRPRDIHEIVQLSVRKVTSRSNTITLSRVLEFGRILHDNNEGYHAFNVVGASTNITIEDVFAEGTCDLLRVGGTNDNANITLRNFFGRGSNRQGLDLAGGKHILVTDGIICEAMLTSLDIETDAPGRFVEDAVFRNILIYNGGVTPNAAISSNGWPHHLDVKFENIHCITDHPGTGKMMNGGAIRLTLRNITMTRGPNATSTDVEFNLHGQSIHARGLIGPNGVETSMSGRRALDDNGILRTYFDKDVDVEMDVTATAGQALSIQTTTTTTNSGTLSATSGSEITVASIAALNTPSGMEVYTDGVTTQGSKILTSATANFDSNDVNKFIGGPGIPHYASIKTRDSATQVQLSAAATATASGVRFAIASNQNAVSIGTTQASYVGISGSSVIGATLAAGASNVNWAVGDRISNLAGNTRKVLRFAGDQTVYELSNAGFTTLTPKSKAGVPSDADYPTTPRNGTRQVNLTTGEVHTRDNGSWTRTKITYGATAPTNPNVGDAWTFFPSIGQVQKAAGTEVTATSSSATFTSTPTSGNLLIAIHRASTALANVTVPTGWTAARTTNNSGATASVGLYYRIADATEGTVTFTTASSVHQGVHVAEYSGVLTTGTLDQTAATAPTGTGTSVPTGWASPTTTQADELVIAAIGLGASGGGWTGSWTNSFTSQATSQLRASWAHRIVAATGTFETTDTWATNAGRSAVLATFKAAVTSNPIIRVWNGTAWRDT